MAKLKIDVSNTYTAPNSFSQLEQGDIFVNAVKHFSRPYMKVSSTESVDLTDGTVIDLEPNNKVVLIDATLVINGAL